jgi:ATP-dependent RNA helicase DDX19/DBP5
LTSPFKGLKPSKAICLAPSRELVTQIMDVVKQMGQYTPVKTFLATKGAQFRGTNIDAHLIVGTPGTVLDVSRARGPSLD